MALSQQTTVRLLGGSDARGLSGDARRVLPQHVSLDFFDACLQRHRSIADLVVDPDHIWDVDGDEARPMGLKAHLQTASAERLASLFDVLVIVSDLDWERAQQNHGDRWLRHLIGGLRASFEDWCVRGQIPRRSPHRPLGVRVFVDGSDEMLGERLGLGPGEFVTGLLPNFYSGPALASRAMLSVMINLPGQWDGYREVVRLYDDQDLLTLGNHWLDNFSHPDLEVPALYRLQYHPTEGLVHLTNPDTEGAYSLTRHDGPDGASVYGIVRSDGHVLAWLILAVIEPTVAPALSESAPGPAQAGADPASWNGDGMADPEAETIADHPAGVPLGDERSVGPTDDTLSDEAASGAASEPLSSPGVLAVRNAELAEASPHEPTLSDGGPTPAVRGAAEVVLAAQTTEAPPTPVAAALPQLCGSAAASGLSHGLFSIREAGVLLQRVHFRAIMLGYEVYISASGNIGSDLPDPAATVQVVGRHVRIFAHVQGVRVAGSSVPVGAAAALGASTQIDINGVLLDYYDRSDVRLQGWPYLGEIRRRGSNIHLTQGGVHKVGRDPSSAVRLPDDSHHGNIIWRREVDAGAVIRSRNGDIPKARFTLDSIMVASSHAEIDLTTDPPLVRNVASNCFSFVRRGDVASSAWIPLSRVERPTGAQTAYLEPGDELYIGNCVLRFDGEAHSAEQASHSVPPPMALSLDDELPSALIELRLPPLPLLPQPPSHVLASEQGSEPQAQGTPAVSEVLRGMESDGVSRTWMEAPSTALRPASVDQAQATADAHVPEGPATPPEPSPESPASVDDAWAPYGAFPDDPTELPVPRFLQKKPRP